MGETGGDEMYLVGVIDTAKPGGGVIVPDGSGGRVGVNVPDSVAVGDGDGVAVGDIDMDGVMVVVGVGVVLGVGVEVGVTRATPNEI